MQSSSSISEKRVTLESMLQILSQFHGCRLSPLQAIEYEVRFLTSKANQMTQTRKIKLYSLRKQIEPLNAEAPEQLSAGMSFWEETEKSVEQSQKQCMKEMDKLQRQKLQKDIQISSLIDERIIEVAQQNEVTYNMQVIQELKQKIKKIQENAQQWKLVRKRKQIRERLLKQGQIRKQIQQISSQEINFRKRWQILKFRSNKLSKNVTNRMKECLKFHELSEKQILNEVQKLIQRISH